MLSLFLFLSALFSPVVFGSCSCPSETSRSTLFTGLSLERASSKENATCTHTHTHLYCQNQTRKPKQNETQLPIADLPPLPTFCLYTFLKILIFKKKTTFKFYALLKIILFCTPIRSLYFCK